MSKKTIGEGSVDSEALTYMVCDVVAGIVHAAADFGYELEEIKEAIQRGIEHAEYERKLTQRGECSHCERPFKGK